ncbi:MAG: hypothetical protein RI973_53 [Bacteroidota bacterium]|jgi:CDP-4-dehydro-6-deoxyglucose reductase
MTPTWYDGKIIRIENESPNTRRLWLQVTGIEHFDFKAGQFITMDLPLGEKRKDRWRSYSIACEPNSSNILEFCIVHMEGGTATRYLFEEAGLGTVIKFKGPDGNFTLPDLGERDLVLICTGTGIAPFRSMIRDLIHLEKPHKQVHLIFGTRHEEGILYRQEFEELAAENPWFHYSVALSRAEQLPAGSNYVDLKKGYVHQIYLEQYASIRPDILFYLCGWSSMIDEAAANLTAKMGYDRSQVRYELYG